MRVEALRNVTDFPRRNLDGDETFWSWFRGEVLPLRPSQYDLTSTCNLTCEGCLFFSGSEHGRYKDQDDPSRVDAFFRGEAARGIRYGYFGGAEPSMTETKLLSASRYLRYGVVFTNGTRRLSTEIPYRVHISVWGRPERSRLLRGADMLGKQVRNYGRDERAVFVFTITARNIDDIEWIAAFCADQGLKLTFNHYSPTSRYSSYAAGRGRPDEFHARNERGDADLRLSGDHLARARDIIGALLDGGSGCILYDHAFNDVIHDPLGLYQDRDDVSGVARDCGVLLTNSLRHHNTDLSRSDAKCCTPNVECSTCRLYAQSFATVLSRRTRRMRDAAERARTIELWRLWCRLFLNDDRVEVRGR